MLHPNEPLWLPKGSVRAIIALFTVIAIVTFFILLGGEVAIAALAGTLGSVVTWYFTTREKANGSD
jgi:membrane associated rhomboid family serine protease